MNEIMELPAKMGAIKAVSGPIKSIMPHTLEDAARMGKLAYNSGLAPHDMKSPEACTIAILHGMEIGLKPMQSLQKIAVINGRPTLWGDAALGLVRASGLLELIREGIEGGRGDERYATCEIKRRDEEPFTRVFSVQDAKKADLWNKKGPWQTYPDRMLTMRARAFALRDAFPDVLGGLYITEEVQGMEEPRDITPPPAPPLAPPAAKDNPPAVSREAEDVQSVEPVTAEMLVDWAQRLDAADEELKLEIWELEINPAAEAGRIDKADLEALRD